MGGWPVILTPQSQEDLRKIVLFIARDSPDRARADRQEEDDAASQ